ncbi:hypothetical protein Tco_0073561 [Tanacetum coccineum]|uniref:Uncharacterized protein n=1 Tax=Tanacetum coccineum TaxID=301880 RepID=A0ABQ4ZAY7_9ASTR
MQSASKQISNTYSTGWQYMGTQEMLLFTLRCIKYEIPNLDHSVHSLMTCSNNKDDGHCLRSEDTDKSSDFQAFATNVSSSREEQASKKTYDIGSFQPMVLQYESGKKKLCKALLEGDKERKSALSISKIKAAPVWYLTLVVQVERIVHQKHMSPQIVKQSDPRCRILSVVHPVSQDFSKNLNKSPERIILRRAVYNELQVLEKDFKNLHPTELRSVSTQYSRQTQPSV